MTEVTSLSLVANFSPLAILCFGDNKQLSPPIFSKFQHRKYKPPKSFRKGGSEQQSGVDVTNTGGDDQDDGPQDTETSQSPEGIRAEEEEWNKGGNSSEPQDTNTADANVKQEEIPPHPATFANKMEASVIHRLLEAGNKSYMLTQNWRQHGMAGEFFNKQFYSNTIKFHQAREKYSLVDKAAVNWLQSLSGKDDINENTLMININPFENCEARSFCNVGNVNFVLEKETRRPALRPQLLYRQEWE